MATTGEKTTINDYGSIPTSTKANGSKNQTQPLVPSSPSLSSRKQQQQQQPRSIWGIIYIMLGAFSFSVMFLVVKLLKNTNTFTLVYYRSWVQIIISATSLLFQGQNLLGPPDWETRFYLVLRAVFGAMAVCAFFFGIQVLPLPDAVTLQFTTPPFAAAFAVCLVGEQWYFLDVVGAIVCLSGVALIAHPTWLFGSAASAPQAEEDETSSSVLLKALAVLVTTGGAAMAGIAYVCVRKIGDRASAIVMVLYYGALSIPMTIVGSGLVQGTWNVWSAGPNGEIFSTLDWFYLLLMGLGGYGGQWFTNLGLQKETAATATLATCTQIVWTYIFELVFLHEGINGWSIGGTGLILGYMLLVALLKTLSTEKQEEVASMRVASMRIASMRDHEISSLLEHHGSSLSSPNGGEISELVKEAMNDLEEGG